MRLSKFQTYLLLLSIIILIGVLYQSIWLFSDTVNGDILQFGTGVGKQFKHVENVTVQYAVNESEYIETYLRNGLPDTTKHISIRYLSFAPSVSRLNTWSGTWGLVIVVFVLAFFCLSIIFLTREIVPSNSTFQIKKGYPFLIRFSAPKTPTHKEV